MFFDITKQECPTHFSKIKRFQAFGMFPYRTCYNKWILKQIESFAINNKSPIEDFVSFKHPKALSLFEQKKKVFDVIKDSTRLRCFPYMMSKLRVVMIV